MCKKSQRQFSQVLDIKQKGDVLRVGDVKSNSKEVTTGSMLWSSIKKRR